jgi:hypothetical protein
LGPRTSQCAGLIDQASPLNSGPLLNAAQCCRSRALHFGAWAGVAQTTGTREPTAAIQREDLRRSPRENDCTAMSCSSSAEQIRRLGDVGRDATAPRHA